MNKKTSEPLAEAKAIFRSWWTHFRSWWKMLEEEGRPCTYYSPAQKAQRILYRVTLNNVVGIGIFFSAWYAASLFERLSGYDPVSKTGSSEAWSLYWLAIGMKFAIVVTDVIYVIISNIVTTTGELFLQIREFREEIRRRWRGIDAAPKSPSQAHKDDGLHKALESDLSQTSNDSPGTSEEP